MMLIVPFSLGVVTLGGALAAVMFHATRPQEKRSKLQRLAADSQYEHRRWLNSQYNAESLLAFYREAYYRMEAAQIDLLSKHIELNKKYQALVDAKTSGFDTPLDCQ